MSDLSILILSAGKGTRMKSQKAKVLQEIGGKPMLFHILEEAEKLTSNITIVLGHQADIVKSAVQKEFPKVDFVLQNTDEFKGTGGAVMSFTPQTEKVLILNGDMPLIQVDELKKLLTFNSDIVMTSIELKNPTGYGRVVKNGDEVVKIVEEKDCSPSEKLINSVNAGVYLINRETLKQTLPKLTSNNSQNEYYLTDIVELAKNLGKTVSVLDVKEENFKGVNSKLDLAKAEEILLKRFKNQLMIDGLTIHLPDTVFIENSVKFIGECEVEQNTTILGNTTIVNSVIKAGSVIEDAHIENSTIGVLAHIRPKSNIKNSKIGNFVEVKKSTLDGVKAGHLSYLGDAEIENGTNIGAGVITANYDGKAKYQTKIGKNVFIGSDSQLIAPVNIPDNSMVGAGSTIPSGSNIPEGSLALSRGNLRVIKNFFFKFFGTKK
jgi:bifunctional UDP-N-acetylglucosamine pyrophosphorylase/glucosamine-1-phosphate N-acetyltransferase